MFVFVPGSLATLKRFYWPYVLLYIKAHYSLWHQVPGMTDWSMSCLCHISKMYFVLISMILINKFIQTSFFNSFTYLFINNAMKTLNASWKITMLLIFALKITNHVSVHSVISEYMTDTNWFTTTTNIDKKRL